MALTVAEISEQFKQFETGFRVIEDLQSEYGMESPVKFVLTRKYYDSTPEHLSFLAYDDDKSVYRVWGEVYEITDMNSSHVFGLLRKKGCILACCCLINSSRLKW